MSKFAELNENTISSSDLIYLLQHKDFPTKLIAFIEESANSDDKFAKKLLTICTSKQDLRVMIKTLDFLLKPNYLSCYLFHFCRALFLSMWPMMHTFNDCTVTY